MNRWMKIWWHDAKTWRSLVFAGGLAGSVLAGAPLAAFASPEVSGQEKAANPAPAENAESAMPAAKTEGAAAEATSKASATLEIGKPAPDFTLTDTGGKKHTLSDYTKQGKVVVLEWFNPDCPFSKKHHVAFHTMRDLSTKLREKKVVWLAINSGAPGKQGAGLERNVKAKKDYGIEYPILLDEAGDVGRAYGAKTTPHMFVISKEGNLVYKGAIDDNTSPTTMGEKVYVRAAVDELLAGKTVTTAETKSYGCSVKYAN